ncbi:ammonium transporter [Candidatus Spongiihabitans sp.]|uniref:ammonium transporter n=1 Tax=Candidatus Spongiihabitans sp. TaxID=3101308 RepID=UPI003C700D6A
MTQLIKQGIARLKWFFAQRSLSKSRFVIGFLGLFGSGLLPAVVHAQDVLDSGDTAWILVATALVLLMTLPGLAFFYSGLVRSINVLSVMMQCCVVACVSSILWLAVGYSIAFGDGGAANAWFGGFGKSFLIGVGVDDLTGTIPEVLFCLFQMTFAIIAPALIIGAYVERIKFMHVVLFSGFWMLIVYAPVAHWIWGGGFLADLGVLDFAGGLVVHATSATAALVLVIMLGPRSGFSHGGSPPHNPGMTMAGAALLWVGWYGFNGGSALTAGGNAAMAVLVTHISAAMAALVWVVIENFRFGKSSLVGLVTGLIAGLASITPASGFVGPVGGLAIGFAGGVVCYLAVDWVKVKLVIDDTLDVFAVHGVGGILGTILTAIFGATTFGGLGLEVSIGKQLVSQLTGVVVTMAWTALGTWLIVLVVRKLVGLRVDPAEESEGLDYVAHGERGYHL